VTPKRYVWGRLTKKVKGFDVSVGGVGVQTVQSSQSPERDELRGKGK
jgi:hypothetical protein